MVVAVVNTIRIARKRCSQRHCLMSFSCIPTNLNIPTSPSIYPHKCTDKDCDDFLPWLRRKSGTDISSVLSIGTSNLGRSLFASKSIQAGESILKVPYNVQLAPGNLLSKVNSFLGDNVGDVAKLALVILVHQKLGQNSEWAPYISRLPQAGEMHSTIFWSDNELKMIQKSSLYQETIKQKEEIEKEFLEIKPVVDRYPEIFEDATLNVFKHAYSLGLLLKLSDMSKVAFIGVAIQLTVSFLEHGLVRGEFPWYHYFLNHDGASVSHVLCDEGEELSEVIADRNYATGDQVLIRYGKFSNATLLLDFGFTLPRNKYDEVQLEFIVPHCDHLHSMKSELLCRVTTPAAKDCNDNSFHNRFTMKEVLCATGKGKGIPQSLRAFFRVLCCTTPQELHELATEASENDGRLARRPFRNKTREIQSHQLLLSRINQVYDDHNTSIKALEPSPSSPSVSDKRSIRVQLARELLTGELHILGSASAWLENYCRSLTEIQDLSQGYSI